MSDLDDDHHQDPQVEDTTLLAQTLFGWTQSPNAGRNVFFGMAGLSAFLILLDFVVHRHTYFDIEKFPAFYAIYGFVAFAFVVVMGWPLRRLLGRSETYYDEDGADG